MVDPIRAYIGLGSNLGDRISALSSALQQMARSLQVTAVSSLYETSPVGAPTPQQDYLNAVAEVETDTDERALLGMLLSIEQSLGRTRERRNAARTIDLDILLYGERTIEEPALTIPHPRMHTRHFVLVPMCELCPGIVHPTQRLTISELLDRCVDNEQRVVTYQGRDWIKDLPISIYSSSEPTV